MTTGTSTLPTMSHAPTGMPNPLAIPMGGRELLTRERSIKQRPSTRRIVDAAVFFAGAVITAGSYGGLAPVLVAGMLYILGWAGLWLTPWGGKAERRMYSRAFSAFFFASGIAAVYANQWSDQVQLTSDASTFHELASGLAAGFTLDEIATEGALAVVIWRTVYEWLSMLGFEKARYIGIGVNILVMALSGVVGVRMVRDLYGDDASRFNRLTWLVSTSGLFWLFAGLHLRDCFVVLTVSLLAYSWQRYLISPSRALPLMVAIAWSVLSYCYLGYLRQEFTLVPVAMAAAAAAALLTATAQPGIRLRLVALTACGACLAGLLIWQFYEQLQSAITTGGSSYADHMNIQSSTGSLGLSLIVNQPAPIRLISGGLYLFAYPIPVWVGFQLHSAYHLFVSINTVGFYFLLPLLALAVQELSRNSRQRRPPVLFLVYLTVGFTAAIALTSLETRHLGAFLVALFVIAAVPSLETITARIRYRRLLMIELGAVAAVHAVWVLLKVL